MKPAADGVDALRTMKHLLLSVLASLAILPIVRADEPLHARIDALLVDSWIGPAADPASDADFFRRASLDFAGMIPTAEETRSFLADPAPDKRTVLIDRLLDSPQFARHQSLVLDLLLMERKGEEKAVKGVEWQEYLCKSVSDNKPLDQLFRELIASDGSDPALRPAAKFLLDRECEPNSVTRDIGRLMFGMDLQCAQCHDHPIVNDYYQADYYGLFAFVMRSSLFNDAKAKKLLVAEKADGDASFKSVFTNVAVEKMPPQLPKGMIAFEPVLAKGEEYVVAPAKNVRPVPKHSRRAQLADLLGESDHFSRNLANRLWGHLFGRGLVHPGEMHHVDNPPSHPKLLTLLADELKRSGYQLKPFLRELALSKAYQRSCDVPSPGSLAQLDLSERIAELESQRTAAAAHVDQLKAAMTEAAGRFAAAREQHQKEAGNLTTLQTSVATAKAAVDKAMKDHTAAETLTATKREQVKALAEAAESAAKAVAKLPEDKVLAEASSQIVQRRQALEVEAEAASKATAAALATLEQTTLQVKGAEEAVAKATTEGIQVEQVQQVEREQLSTRRRWLDAQFRVKQLEAQLALARDLVRYRELTESDPAAAAALWPSIVDRWETSCQVSRLRPLSAEQFALSLMQASGQVTQPLAAAKAALDKAPPEEIKNASESEKSRLLAIAVEQKAFGQLRGNMPAFVTHYGSLLGGDFQATVNQALYFANGAVVETWSGGLGEQLAKHADANALADELYLTVLTRFPTDEERTAVATHLQGREADRLVAIREMAWGLLSSNEFRFNH